MRNQKLKAQLQIWFLLIFLLGETCPFLHGQSPDKLSVTIAHKSLQLNWGGKARLVGGLPVIQGEKLTAMRAADAKDLYLFGAEEKIVAVRVKETAYENVACLQIEPRGQYAHEAEEFAGLFFDSFPAYARGVYIWRYKPWNAWTKPIQVEAPGKMKEWDVQFFYWQYEDCTYGAALPLSGNGYRTTLGGHKGSFGSKATSYVKGVYPEQLPAMAIGFGNEPYRLFEQLYAAGLKFMGKEENLRTSKVYPEILEYLGWCSWNASENGSALGESLLLEIAQEYQSKKVPLGWVLIDDGWSQHSENSRKLTSLEPDPAKFPNDFKPVVEKLIAQYHIKEVGAWHTINMYWAGVDKDSDLGKRYQDDLFSWNEIPPNSKDGKGKICYMISPYSDALPRFYNEWYTYLKEQGIGFVKVDNQLIVERMAKHNFPIWSFAEKMHQELNKAVATHFSNAIINCMDMTNEAFYNFGTTAVARTVEDYFPYKAGESYNMEAGNAAAHVTQALYNTLYFQQMVLPDFDMFESRSPNAEFHAVARAVSGGPVYLTDNTGQVDAAVIRPLIASDGKILRADAPARLTEDCLFQVQDASPLKAYSFANKAGLLAI